MNKLTALSKLAGAYHYLFPPDVTVYAEPADIEAIDTLAQRFHYIRRSLTLADLKPAPKSEEGYNGRMPTFF